MLSPEPSELKLLYAGLLGLSEQQRLALEAQDTEGFFEISLQRDALFERLKGEEAQAGALPAGGREAIGQIISRLLENDKQVESLARGFGERSMEELRALQTGLQALHSYLPENGGRSAFFIDRSR